MPVIGLQQLKQKMFLSFIIALVPLLLHPPDANGYFALIKDLKVLISV
jgi:hypothetical protein